MSFVGDVGVGTPFRTRVRLEFPGGGKLSGEFIAQRPEPWSKGDITLDFRGSSHPGAGTASGNFG